MVTAQWASVVGYEGLYEVSTEGRIRSARRAGAVGGLIKPDPSGAYPSVRLFRDGRRRHLSLHVIVITAFVGPRPDGMECRHLDGHPTNPHLDNLAWGTSGENSQDMILHGHTNSRITSCPSGHEYTPENTYIWGGRRYCKACNRIHTRDGQRRRRAAKKLREAS